MSIGREDYAERKEARIDRLESRAAKAKAESTTAYHAARSIMDHIPPGQPILVGHHSEKRHCRDLDKIDRNMRKSVEADRKASYYASRAEAAASNTAISNDDPNALEKLEAKLAKLQAAQEEDIPDARTLTEWEEAENRRQLTAILETVEDGRVEYLNYLDAYIKDYQKRYCEDDASGE